MDGACERSGELEEREAWGPEWGEGPEWEVPEWVSSGGAWAVWDQEPTWREDRTDPEPGSV